MKGTVGLCNVGNTCYLNATIQCLRHCTDLSKFMISENYKEYLKDNDEKYLLTTWHELLYKLWSGSSTAPYNPTQFIRTFISVSQSAGYSTFISFQQNDVDEFLVNLINMLHNGMSYKMEYSLSGEAVTEQDKHALQAYKRWKGFFESDYSIFVKHFYSQYITKTECPECDYVTYSYDPTLVVHLPIPNKEDVTLYDCLDLFTDGEELDSDNKWTCDKCKVSCQATVHNKFWDTSKYFIILLKRYNRFSKNNSYIDIPEELDIKKYAINYRKGIFKYSLFGICHHSGGMGGGHYYASCKTKDNWYEYNDTNVKKLDDVDFDNAYCLFYRLIE